MKWQAQLEQRSRSRQLTIKLQRRELRKLLDEMPSLARFLADHLAEIYPDAVTLAAAETYLPEEAFPAACPFALEQILDDEFLPG